MRWRSSFFPRAVRLWRDEGGAVLVLVTLTLPVILAIGSMVVDLGRVGAQHTEMQAFVDQVALAAAAELDGEPDAIARAREAARTFIAEDRQTWAGGAAGLSADADGDVTFRFLTDLPGDDTAIPSGVVTTIDGEARFVEVTAAPRTVEHVLAGAASAALGAIGVEGGLAETTDVTASAVAGSETWFCDQTPLMFCTPTGMDRQSLRSFMTAGKMMWLKNGSTYAPGAFGLLDVAQDASGPCGAPNQGANYWRCAVGLVSGAGQCTTSDGTVGIRPGNMAGPTDSGINTRFDIFETSLKKERDNPLYAPAPNVVKGMSASNGKSPNGKNKKAKSKNGKGDACLGNNPSYGGDTVPLPRDTCFPSNAANGNGNGNGGGGCPDGRFGNGVWDEDAYIDANHDGAAPAGYARGGTRYEMYLAEIAAANGGDILAGKDETGRPECSSQMTTDPSRRVMTVAAIDCVAHGVQGNASGIPVMDYYNVFLTEPAGISGNGDIWVEVIGHAGNGRGGSTGPGLVHDVVQLYR